MVFVRMPSGVKNQLSHQHGETTVSTAWGSSCPDCGHSNPPKTAAYPDGFRVMEVPLDKVVDMLDRHPGKGIMILDPVEVMEDLLHKHPDVFSRPLAKPKPPRKRRRGKKGGR